MLVSCGHDGFADGYSYGEGRVQNASFFGIESGNDQVLELMRKTYQRFIRQGHAVYAAKAAGLEVGAFFHYRFIPEKNDKSILDTIRFASKTAAGTTCRLRCLILFPERHCMIESKKP